jgi:hypothetical protein
MRLPTGPAADGVAPPLTAIQRMVSAAVHRRTGVALRTGGTNLDLERGLVVLAFERVRTSAEPGNLEPLRAGPVRGAG